jgi:hypothetical protein
VKWWAWGLVGFFGTAAVLSAYKRYLYRDALPAGDTVPGSSSAILAYGCDHFIVDDNHDFAEWLSAQAREIDQSGSNAAFTARLMRVAFPTCTWPPTSAWRITFEQGTSSSWNEFVQMVGSSRNA